LVIVFLTGDFRLLLFCFPFSSFYFWQYFKLTDDKRMVCFIHFTSAGNSVA